MADGSVYTGSFVRGKEEGKGVLIEKDGTRFEGFFKQGKKDGPFVEMDANGNIVRKRGLSDTDVYWRRKNNDGIIRTDFEGA